jgi:hypothetical protein
MMKNVAVISGIILLIFAVSRCEKESRDSASTLELVKTNAGGCNRLELKSAGEHPDTVVFSVESDSLNIFTGVNYICCAPFGVDLKTKSDSVLITITDICAQEEACYCLCSCYYTWDFKLLKFENKSYFYRVMLVGRDETRVIQKGTFTLEGPDITVE